MLNKSTGYNLGVAVLAVAHMMCVEAEWDTEKAIRLVDAYARENDPDMDVEVYKMLCTAIRWMCGTMAESSYEDMVD